MSINQNYRPDPQDGFTPSEADYHELTQFLDEWENAPRQQLLFSREPFTSVPMSPLIESDD